MRLVHLSVSKGRKTLNTPFSLLQAVSNGETLAVDVAPPPASCRRRRAVRADLQGECVDALVERTIQGDVGAWRALWIALEPTVGAVAASWGGSGRFSHDADDRRNIVVSVMGKLRADDFRRLRLYLASTEHRGQGSFQAWLVTVAARSAISYHRAHRRDLRCAQLVSEDTEPGIELREAIKAFEAREVLEKAREHLAEAQLAALLLWLEGRDHEEIAERLQLEDAASADRLVRSGLWRLRDRLGARDRALASRTKKKTRPTDGLAVDGVVHLARVSRKLVPATTSAEHSIHPRRLRT
jgi:DNA-directed RNA polymerase specialized sigma24 family protein